jgi:hypothetical protein
MRLKIHLMGLYISLCLPSDHFLKLIGVKVKSKGRSRQEVMAAGDFGPRLSDSDGARSPIMGGRWHVGYNPHESGLEVYIQIREYNG